MARTRCGNRVAYRPSGPVSPTSLPQRISMRPIFGPSVSTPYLAAFSAPAPPFSSHAQPSVTPSGPFLPFSPIPGGGGGVPSLPPTAEAVVVEVVEVPVITAPRMAEEAYRPPPVGIPEPGTAGLLCPACRPYLAGLHPPKQKNVLNFIQ